MWIVSFDNIMVIFTSFVVCRMIPATQGAFCWGVFSLCAICAVLRATAFDTRVGFITVRSCVSVLLTSCALWDVFLVCTREFDVDDLILDGCYIVYVFIVVSWFQVNEEQV